MEHQVNIIFILVLRFSIIEPIPFSEEGGRYGSHQSINRPKNSNPPRHHQNYPRPQNFYPTVNNASNRNYNQDYRPYERTYENRYNTVPQGTGEKRPFYEGPNGRNNRPHYQPATTTTGGQNLKDKFSLDGGPPPYRPQRQYEYDDRNNGRYSPQVERNYQQPLNRPYYTPRITLQRPVAENVGNRYRDFPPQRSGYVDKQLTPQERTNSPGDFKYSNQNQASNSVLQNLKPALNLDQFTTSNVLTTPQPRHEINKILSDPEIQHYLVSNHKRYLILHSNGTVEHVDSLDPIVQNYPNYVMVKAGDIIRNPKNNSLELLPPTPRNEILSPKIPEVLQGMSAKQKDFPIYGYNNTRVPYVTDKAYAQPTNKPVSNSYEDKEIPNGDEFAITATSASNDTLSSSVESTTEFYTSTPSAETTTEYGTPMTLFEINTEKDISDTTTDYTTPTPLLVTTMQFTNSGIESAATSTATQLENRDPAFTGVEIVSEDTITEAKILVTTEDYLNLASTTNYPSVANSDNLMLNDNNTVPKQERKENIIPKLRDFYSSAFGKMLERLVPILPIRKTDTTTNDQTSHIANEGSVTDPIDVTDIIDGITELNVINSSTTEMEQIVNDIKNFNTSVPFADVFSYTTPRKSDQTQNAYTETLLTLGQNEENTDSLNPFITKEDEQLPSDLNTKSKDTIGNQYDPIMKNYNDDTSVLYTTTEYINPFITFDDQHNEPSLDDEINGVYNSPSPFLVYEESVTNPFADSTAVPTPEQRRKMRNKKRLQLTTENYSEYSKNPFTTIPDTADNNMISVEDNPEFYTDVVTEIENGGTLNPFINTNPFNEDVENSFILDYDVPNPFTDNYADEVTLSPIEIPVTEDNPLVFDESENVYETNIVPYAYFPTENSDYDLPTTPVSDFDLNIVPDEFDDYSTTAGEVVVLTTTEKPTVWFKTDAEFWEKLSNGTIPYDVVYFFQGHPQPLVEKDTKTTIFPNGTIVQEYIETVWEREGDQAPILVKSSKTVYPDEEP